MAKQTSYKCKVNRFQQVPVMVPLKPKGSYNLHTHYIKWHCCSFLLQHWYNAWQNAIISILKHLTSKVTAPQDAYQVILAQVYLA